FDMALQYRTTVRRSSRIRRAAPARPDCLTMRLFAPAIAFVDLETTGTSAGSEAITEMGIVRVDAPGDGAPRVREWSTLVQPGVPVPPEIQALTGISNAMERDAPRFEAIASTVRAWLADALFVAHNARFDYAFLKHAFARIGERYRARVLCTVKLSRRLFPDAQGHGLDAVIARCGNSCRPSIATARATPSNRASIASCARRACRRILHPISSTPCRNPLASTFFTA